MSNKEIAESNLNFKNAENAENEIFNESATIFKFVARVNIFRRKFTKYGN